MESLTKPGVPVPYEIRYANGNGGHFWAEGILTNMMGIEGVNAVVANYRDITKRKELETLLSKANALARIGGWEIDLVKETVYWTDITREIHETSMDYITGLLVRLDFYKEGSTRDFIKQKIKEAIEEGKPWDVELQITTARKNSRWIRSIGETEFINGKCIRVYGSFQDIPSTKRNSGKTGIKRTAFPVFDRKYC